MTLFTTLLLAMWYRIENVREALEKPSNWYLDRATGVLTYLAKSGEEQRGVTPACTLEAGERIYCDRRLAASELPTHQP